MKIKQFNTETLRKTLSGMGELPVYVKTKDSKLEPAKWIYFKEIKGKLVAIIAEKDKDE